jgi:hypothetical protein
MNEKLVPYADFGEKIESQYKKLKESENYTALAKIDEFKDLHLAISSFQKTIKSIKSGKSVVNSAYLYDRTLSIRDISGNFDTPWTNQILKDANETLVSEGKLLTLDETNHHLFDYYSVMSDMKFISDTMSETCVEISKTPNRGGLKDLDEFANALKSKVDGILLKMTGFFGSVGEDFRDAFQDLAKFLKEKVVDKLKEAFKKAADALDKLKLMMLESMFRFIVKVAELAKQNGWTVKEINVEMPEIGVKFEKLEIASISTPIPIPMPQITPPKVSMKFVP